MNFILTLLILCSFGFSHAGQKEVIKIPTGWKLAKAPKQSGCDRKQNDLLTAKGDFDGDGKEDTAKILARSKGKGIAVWIWLASQKDPIQTESTDHHDGQHDMGIALVKIGKYDTACGKEYWNCKPNEPAKLELKNAAIDFFTCESANQFIFWDMKDKKFNQVWISD